MVTMDSEYALGRMVRRVPSKTGVCVPILVEPVTGQPYGTQPQANRSGIAVGKHGFCRKEWSAGHLQCRPATKVQPVVQFLADGHILIAGNALSWSVASHNTQGVIQKSPGNFHNFQRTKAVQTEATVAWYRVSEQGMHHPRILRQSCGEKRFARKMAFRMGSSSSKSVNKSGNMRIDGTNSNFTAGKRLCVLIVDDDPVIQRIHSVLLRRFGLETQVVGNGKEAVDLYRSGASFHLVLMDMEMPIMDGPKATRELRAMGVNSMIVGMTSRDQDSEKLAFMAAGLDDCHTKPLTVDTITSLLQELNKKH
ncbi:hypothetical protein HYC85_030792 [Camellia sinensis]|uniref:Response regulatory domain-containing protein n=1 Tax=Camellia sinensis TaxID=4442 RepID=A0A7J7G3M4_CAMSI|nr:hypothetical protein HYC85_030792 [Camellia sinensis]